MNLRILGFTLRLQWEWLRRTQPEAVWASLPQRHERISDSMFCSSVTITLGDKAAVRFWIDHWLPEGPICTFALNLFHAVGARRRSRTVREALHQR